MNEKKLLLVNWGIERRTDMYSRGVNSESIRKMNDERRVEESCVLVTLVWYRFRSELTYRMRRTHAEGKTHSREVCTKPFAKSDDLTTRSGKKKIGIRVKFFTRSFAQTGPLTKHERTRSGEKPNRCERLYEVFCVYSRRLSVARNSRYPD